MFSFFNDRPAAEPLFDGPSSIAKTLVAARKDLLSESPFEPDGAVESPRNRRTFFS